jgi:hypothetical protein
MTTTTVWFKKKGEKAKTLRRGVEAERPSALVVYKVDSFTWLIVVSVQKKKKKREKNGEEK